MAQCGGTGGEVPSAGNKLTVLDAAALDLTGIPAEVQDIVAPLVLHAIASDYCLRLSQRLGHPMSSRRYMGIMKY